MLQKLPLIYLVNRSQSVHQDFVCSDLLLINLPHVLTGHDFITKVTNQNLPLFLPGSKSRDAWAFHCLQSPSLNDEGNPCECKGFSVLKT